MKISIVAAFMASVLLFSGCQTTVNTVERSAPQAAPQYVDDIRIVTDKSLAKSISILNVVEGTVSGNLLKIQVTLMSNSSKPKNVSYRFEWVDKNGMTVSSSTSNWKSLRLMGKEQKSVSAIAPNPSVVDFIFKLQEPNN